ncbi:MAG: hypothetical protein ABIL09_21305, partial [Gemmatimonadota bacterium]
IQEEIDAGRFTWSQVRDLKQLYARLGDLQVQAQMHDVGEMRSIMTSAFPLLCSGLTIAGLNAAYEAVPTIGQELVTEIDDPKDVTTLAGITSQDVGLDRVDESRDFPEIGAGEEKYTVTGLRNGRRISITKDMIEKNDVTGIVGRINALAEIMSEFVEKMTLQRVCDVHGSASSAAEPYVMHRNGAAASLYSATADTPSTRTPSGTRILNNALVDTTDLDAARAVLSAMKNSRGERIAIPLSRCILLVPDALLGTALKIRGSQLQPSVENEVNNWGPVGAFQPRVLSSPKLDDLSTTAWYLGWFPRQFVRVWGLRAEYVELGETTESYLRNRTAYQARMAWRVGVGVQDHNLVVQSLSGTVAATAPTAANVS